MARRHTPLPYGMHPSAYGGILRNRALGRGQRTLSVKHSMHLVLRSALARGVWSFVQPRNKVMINKVLAKHARATGVELLAVGNAGNHLHLRVRFTQKQQYFRFIRSVAGEIALKIKRIPNPKGLFKRNFWERRPFSSIVSNSRYVVRLVDYIKINDLEGRGYTRALARLIVEKWRDGS
jgi:REP element-mobilizing transposase RayT